MKIIDEVSLNNFNFWGGAIDNANKLSYKQMEEVEAILEDTYFDGIDATTLNDIFWFDFDTICEWLGIDTEEEEEDEEEEEE